MGVNGYHFSSCWTEKWKFLSHDLPIFTAAIQLKFFVVLCFSSVELCDLFLGQAVLLFSQHMKPFPCPGLATFNGSY